MLKLIKFCSNLIYQLEQIVILPLVFKWFPPEKVAKTGDGLASALQVIALILRSGKKASTALNPFKLYPQNQDM